jgi:TrmH family RNA methyltransferase
VTPARTGAGGEPSREREGSPRSGPEPAAPRPAEAITSRKNPLIQELRALAGASSRRTARCVVEGWRFLGAAQAAGADVRLVVLTPAAAADPRGAEVRRRLAASGVRMVAVSAYVFDALTQVETPQGVLGVVRRPAPASPSVLDDPRALCVVLDGVQDPANVGAILRTAAAVGATAGVIAGAAADPYGPKAIRASAGTVFSLPLLSFPAPPAAAAALAARGIAVLVADPSAGRAAEEVSFRRPLALVFGSEGAGSAPVWRDRGTAVRLPMAAPVESLGVAAAAAVLLYRAASL